MVQMVRWVAAITLLWSSAAAPLDAAAFVDIGARGARASSPGELGAAERSFRGRIPDTKSPRKLVEGADALGKLVARARELNPPTALFAALRADADQMIERVRAVRGTLEDRAGEEEAAIEALYRSTDWQRLDYCQVTAGYWGGWASLGQGQQLPGGSERRAAMEGAAASFSRSALELRLPKVAAASLLGLGIAQRNLGDKNASERSLRALLQQLQRAPDAQLDAAARFELASMALERGEVSKASALIAAIPKKHLSRSDRLDLTRREAEGLLKSRSDLDRAAQLLRELLAAGDPYATHAAALANQHQKILEGRDLGALGSLLAAERAFGVGDYPAARASYADLLRDAKRVPGLNRANVEYKYAFALAETGGLAEAAKILDRLTADRDAGSARALAAPLFYSVAERIVADGGGPASQAQALRAAERLLKIAPEAPGVEGARYRAARGREAKGNLRSSIAQLKAIPESSAAYPAARLDLVRLHGAELQRLEQRGQSKALRKLAPQLADDIRRVRALVARGKLAADPERDTTLQLWSAKSTYWSGGKPDQVDARIREARAASPGAEGERTLLRLELRNRVRARQWTRLDQMIEKRSEAALRRDFAIWHEGLNAAKRGRAPKQQIVRWYARLASVAPEKSRETLSLGHAEALLAAGQPGDAVKQAEALIQGDRYWADAWIVYAEALEKSGDDKAAFSAWRRISDGTESGTTPWADAKLRAAEVARRQNDASSACAAIDGLEEAELGAAAQRRLAKAAEGCATE